MSRGEVGAVKSVRFLSQLAADGVENTADYYDICDANGLRFGVVVVDGLAYSISVPAEWGTITDACVAEGWLP